MAYTDTALLTAFAKAFDIIQANQSRKQMTGALELAVANQSSMITVGELARVKKSVNQPTKIYVLGRNDTAVTEDRVCDPTGPGSSRAIEVTWDHISTPFSISHDEIEENEFSFDEVFVHEVAEAVRRLDEAHDAAIITALTAHLTSGTATVPYTPAAGVINIPQADYVITGTNPVPTFLAKMTSQFAVDRFVGNLDLIGDPVVMSILSAMMNQGTGNAGNVAYQFLNWNGRFSNNMPANGAGDYAKAFAIPGGLFTTATWAKTRTRDIGTDKWFTMPHPTRPGVMLEVKMKAACTDNSGTIDGAGNDLVEGWSIGYDHTTVFAGEGLADTGVRRLDFQTT